MRIKICLLDIWDADALQRSQTFQAIAKNGESSICKVRTIESERNLLEKFESFQAFAEIQQNLVDILLASIVDGLGVWL